MNSLCRFALVSVVLVLSGCKNIGGYKADEVHHTISFPLVFTDSIHALGITKKTNIDGTTVRKAETLTHETVIGGFTRTVTYKGAELKEAKGE